jgi:hypothetical protein
MTTIDKRTAANMDVVLEQVCSVLPHGGDHERRKHIAQQLLRSASAGNVTLEALRSVASRALSELSATGQPERRLDGVVRNIGFVTEGRR